MMSENSLPAVKQNSETGASAVAAGANRWGVMHPVHGGHWADDAEVADWPVLVPAAAPDEGGE